jgi:Erg28 like protein
MLLIRPTIHCFLSHRSPSPNIWCLDSHVRCSSRICSVPHPRQDVCLSSTPPPPNGADSFCDSIYDMTLFTFLIAFGHFTSELLIFRTATINFGVLSPCIVASESNPFLENMGSIVDPLYPQATSLIWMFQQYDYYVQA